MSCISISFNRCNNNMSIFILKFNWFSNRNSSSFWSSFVNGCCILNSKSNIPDSISMTSKMATHFICKKWCIWVIDWIKDKNGSITAPYDMACNSSLTSFKTFICIVLESKSASIKGSSLFCISDPKRDMVYIRK